MFVFKCYYHIMAILKKILFKLIYGKRIKFGKGVTFRKGFSLIIEKNAMVIIGNNCFFNNYCTICAKENIVIGNDCLFGENVKIYDNNHIFKNTKKLIREQGDKTGRIVIGNNCWIANNVMITKNTNIGEHCVISTGEKVNGNIPNNSVYKNSYITEIQIGGKDA